MFTERILDRERIKELLEYLYKRYKLVVWGEGATETVLHYFEDIVSSKEKVSLSKQLGVNSNEIVVVGDKKKRGSSSHYIEYEDPEKVKGELERIDPKNIFLGLRSFRCTQCGECCRLLVKVSHKDIVRIEETGHKQKDFLAYDPIKRNPKTKDILMQAEGVCIFLRRQGNQFYCGIYNHRPDACRKYPFIKNRLKLVECVPKYFAKPDPLAEILNKREQYQ